VERVRTASAEAVWFGERRSRPGGGADREEEEEGDEEEESRARSSWRGIPRVQGVGRADGARRNALARAGTHMMKGDTSTRSNANGL